MRSKRPKSRLKIRSLKLTLRAVPSQPMRNKRPSTGKRSREKPEPVQENTSALRLNQYIAHSGVCSRREADELIKAGKVSVNGKKVTQLGVKVLPSDKVVFQGKTLKPERYVYLLLNKPKDFITTTSDPQERKTVMQLVEKACTERNVQCLILRNGERASFSKITTEQSGNRCVYRYAVARPTMPPPTMTRGC